jgi:hypothetical protein
MYSGKHLAMRQFWLIASFAAFMAVGCSHQQSADEATDAALKAQGLDKETVYPLAGKVTVDGQPPQAQPKSNPIVVVLNDMSKPDVPPRERRRVELNPQGDFAFNTYKVDDGVPAGKYVVTFAQFKYNKKKGLLGPDQLKNLYNDPDKNAQNKDFVIDHQSSGKTDYLFNLEVQGKEAAAAGPHSLTEVPDK